MRTSSNSPITCTISSIYVILLLFSIPFKKHPPSPYATLLHHRSHLQCRPYLRACLESILAQSETDWECLCVNDGSTDGSAAILEAYARKDKRFKIFHKPNGGVSSARNVGLAHAQGEWIWFVDGDDIIATTALATCRALIETHPPFDALIFDNHIFDDQTSPSIPPYEEHHILHQHLTFYLYKRFIKGVGLTLLKRSHLNTLRFKPYRLAEDSLFALEYLFRSHRIFETNLKLYFYRTRLGSAIHRPPDILHVRDWFYACKEILTSFDKHKHRFSDEDIQKIVDDLLGLLYYTHCLKYFKLPHRDRKTLLPLWLSNMKTLIHLGHVPLSKRIVVAIITVVRSIWLTKTLVVKPLRRQYRQK